MKEERFITIISWQNISLGRMAYTCPFGYNLREWNAEVFYSPEDTRFKDTEALKKGEYTSTNTRLNQTEGELSVTWAKMLESTSDQFAAGKLIWKSFQYGKDIRHKVF